MISSSAPQVLESVDRWSKCRNRFEEIGCVPSNILEPLSALDAVDSSVVHREVPPCCLALQLGPPTHPRLPAPNRGRPTLPVPGSSPTLRPALLRPALLLSAR